MPHARCLCGDVSWQVEGPLRLAHHCHCRRCQKSHGVGYVTLGAVPLAALRWRAGEAAATGYASSPGGERRFCPRCGSPVPDGSDFRGLTFVPLGPLEGEVEATLDGHIFAASKAAWHEICDGLPAFDTYPPGVDAPVLDDLERGSRAPGRIGGSCLCGQVRFELDGPPEHLRHCHCLRCRRGRAAAHASNAFVQPERFRWTRGERDVAVFRLPEAKRFSQAFCRTCGGKAPWLIEARGSWNVPLGCLDDDPGARPSEHIFVGSKAAWHQIHDELPRFDGYPTA